MDAWSGDQLKKMQLGGNDALNAFLAKYSVDKFTDIKEKYNSQAAEVRPVSLQCNCLHDLEKSLMMNYLLCAMTLCELGDVVLLEHRLAYASRSTTGRRSRLRQRAGPTSPRLPLKQTSTRAAAAEQA